MLEEESISRKSHLLILSRFFILVCCFIGISIQQGSFDTLAHRLLFLVFTMNVVYLFLSRVFQKNSTGFVIFQIAVDLLFISLLVYITGGILSIFISLYFGSILACGMMISPRSSFICASLATMSISAIALAHFLNILKEPFVPMIPEQTLYPSITQNDLPFCKAYLFLQGVAFHLVALLTDRLSHALSHVIVLHEEILQNLMDGVFVIDTKQNLLYINRQAKSLLGIENRSISHGQPIFHLLDPDRHREILQLICTHKIAGKRDEVKQDIQIKLGDRTIPLHLDISIFSTSKKVKAYIVVLIDISDRKRMEEAIRRAHRMETIYRMASTIAHEVRNPLASIRGAVQEIKNLIPSEDERYILMDIAIREADRINGIVSDFLSYSKVRIPVFQRINLSHLIQEFVFLFKQRSEFEKGKISTNLQENLVIWGDPEHLKQVFYNVGINALESSRDILEINISANPCSLWEYYQNCPSLPGFKPPNQKGVEIRFSDQGKGIEPESIQKLFTPFFTTKERGSGMGLALVSRILDLHDALYHISSVPNVGTTFYIWFPEEARSS